MNHAIADWLPGTLSIERGTRRDYLELERFHYVAKRPAVWAGVWRVLYEQPDKPKRVVAVGVLTYPVPSCLARERALDLGQTRYEATKIRWLNRNLRTISRIIVHPQFRGVGLASELVRVMCRESGVKHIEAMAMMGIAVPFFERAGMQRHQPPATGRPVYYLWHRGNKKLSNGRSDA
jgi:ribosomal protein S18 acetylase RimI-like enzyme